jgi:hypothetical protein
MISMVDTIDFGSPSSGSSSRGRRGNNKSDVGGRIAKALASIGIVGSLIAGNIYSKDIMNAAQNYSANRTENAEEIKRSAEREKKIVEKEVQRREKELKRRREITDLLNRTIQGLKELRSDVKGKYDSFRNFITATLTRIETMKREGASDEDLRTLREELRKAEIACEELKKKLDVLESKQEEEEKKKVQERNTAINNANLECERALAHLCLSYLAYEVNTRYEDNFNNSYRRLINAIENENLNPDLRTFCKGFIEAEYGQGFSNCDRRMGYLLFALYLRSNLDKIKSAEYLSPGTIVILVAYPELVFRQLRSNETIQFTETYNKLNKIFRSNST